MTRNLTLLVLFFAVVLAACGERQQGNTTRIVVPGDRNALEQLAEAWEEVSEQWPAPPLQLMPEGRRKFVEQVFTSAGYSYTHSLIETGRLKLDPFNNGQKDLCELLLTPARGMADQDLGQIYSPPELAAVTHIRKTFP